jgi:acetyl esterase/lipase
MNRCFFHLLFVACSVLSISVAAQNPVPPSSPGVAAVEKNARPEEIKDVSYLRVADVTLTLDLYRNPRPGPSPVLVYFHGGGWWKGQRPQSYGGFRGFLNMGFSVVTVDYRLTPVAAAPAAVQDARCALSWIKQNASKYNLDAGRVVTYGTSAGGHLALMAGMLPQSNDIDLPQCKDLPTVVAILDFYGPTDLVDITDSENKRGWATRWIADSPDPADMAKRMSPITYVRAGLPPVFIVHGDSDPTVPYAQSVRLQRALDSVHIPNKFLTVPGGLHGKFEDGEKKAIQSSAREFLIDQNVIR